MCVGTSLTREQRKNSMFIQIAGKENAMCQGGKLEQKAPKSPDSCSSEGGLRCQKEHAPMIRNGTRFIPYVRIVRPGQVRRGVRKGFSQGTLIEGRGTMRDENFWGRGGKGRQGGAFVRGGFKFVGRKRNRGEGRKYKNRLIGRPITSRTKTTGGLKERHRKEYQLKGYLAAEILQEGGEKETQPHPERSHQKMKIEKGGKWNCPRPVLLSSTSGTSKSSGSGKAVFKEHTLDLQGGKKKLFKRRL